MLRAAVDVLRVRSADVRRFTAHVASCRHPVKGDMLFALADVRKGGRLATLKLDEVVEGMLSLEALTARLAALDGAGDQVGCRELLEHTCPAGNGLYARQRPEHFNALFNHSARPSVIQRGECGLGWARMIGDSGPTTFSLEAVHDIHEGDELCVDYNHSVGYERADRGGHVDDFLLLCERFGVEKRPSFLTLPPARVHVEA